MLEFNLTWGYYYAVMLMAGTILLISLVSLTASDITRIVIKINKRILDDRIACARYKDQKIAELSKKAQLAASVEERYKTFDEMREYREIYLKDRRLW